MPNLCELEASCCGCSACADVCPKNAISMAEKDGFLYPQVDSSKCVDCKLCEKVCSFKGEKITGSNCLKAFAAKACDDVRMSSSSGGVFTVLSDLILSQGGVVYGAVYKESMRVCHTCANSKELRDKMRGSKYIQSDLSGIYRQVAEDLKAKKKVLFVGVPCQVSALKSFLKCDYNNLYTADLVCHGVPSNEVWQKFVKCINEKYNKTLIDYSFRNKQVSWRRYSPKLTFSDGTVVGENNLTASFIELFRYDVSLRPSCTECRYSSDHREGDFTMGDFWGIENLVPEMDDGKGVSALMINSFKAEELFGAMKEQLLLHECTVENIMARQPNMSRPSKPSVKAQEFKNDLQNLPFDKVLKKYTRVGLKRRMIDSVKKLLGKQ